MGSHEAVPGSTTAEAVTATLAPSRSGSLASRRAIHDAGNDVLLSRRTVFPVAKRRFGLASARWPRAGRQLSDIFGKFNRRRVFQDVFDVGDFRPDGFQPISEPYGFGLKVRQAPARRFINADGFAHCLFSRASKFVENVHAERAHFVKGCAAEVAQGEVHDMADDPHI